jgi:SAM-dependent methyltransferase
MPAVAPVHGPVDEDGNAGYGSTMTRGRKDYLTRYYPESRFGGFTRVDGTIAFYSRVHSLLDRSAAVLDVGCGRGAYGEDAVRLRRELRIFAGKCRRVIGIDVDERARDNPFLDEFRPIKGRWPIEDASIDLCLSDSVLEHVAEPEVFFQECRRVLKPGGYLCLRTPNAHNYISLFSRLIPARWHAALLRRVLYVPKQEQDIFPTVYRCNTKRRLRRMLTEHGFDPCVYGHEAEPYHLGFSRFAYLCGVLHQRYAPRLFRTTLFVFARKIR